MVFEFVDLLVESYGTWLLLQRLVDASKDSDIPKNVPFAFAINNRSTREQMGQGRSEDLHRHWNTYTHITTKKHRDTRAGELRT